jgi:hypothetical protein
VRNDPRPLGTLERRNALRLVPFYSVHVKFGSVQGFRQHRSKRVAAPKSGMEPAVRIASARRIDDDA